MKAGFFETDITPAIGMEMPGGYGKAYISAVHDPLKVRVSVFDDGNERVALVGLDGLCMAASTVARIRRQAAALCGIKEDHILLAASHAHSGGPINGCFAADYADAPEPVRTLACDYSITVNPAYHEQVIDQAVQAVVEADRRKEEVLVSFGAGHEDRVVFNRRLRMKNGRVYTHPGKGNPDIVGPAGPVDPEVGVVGAWSRSGKLLGCIVNYACHGTTFGGRAVSADWIYYLETTVRGVMGGETVVVFLNGASGDITQVDNLSPREPEFGEKWSRLVGTRVGAEAVKVLVSVERGDAAPVRAIRKVLTFNRRIPSKKRFETALTLVEQGLADMAAGRRTFEEVGTTDWTFAKEVVHLDYLARKEPKVRVEIQAVQIGPAVFLANPAEYFCQHGLNIKKRAGFPYTFVVELANGAAGYVPTPDAFGPDGGGYETILSHYSNLPVDAGRTIEDTSVELAKSLTPGRVPPGSTTKFCGPWEYGVRGPEIE